MAHKPAPITHRWRIKNSSPMPTPIANDLSSSLTTSARSLLPSACEVIPLVPILRNPKSQYTTLKSIAPTAMAPM